MEKFCFAVLIFTFCILNFTGCATVVESAKGVAGISTKSIEEKRKEAITKTFDCNYDTCFYKTKRILTHSGSYIYAQNKKKQMIAVYISEEDTTPVGIFFKEQDKNKTQIEVSSSSTYCKELISARLFLALEKSLNKKAEDAEEKQE